MVKKILFLLLTFFTVNTVWAFNIDMDKIDINSRGKSLVNSFDSTYKIEVNDFSNKIINDEAATKLAKELVSITQSNKEQNEKVQEYTKKMYIDKAGEKALASALLRDTYFSEMKKYRIEGGYISDIKTVSFNNDVLAFVYLKGAKVSGNDNAVVFTYWLKKDKNEYKVYFPWVTVGNKMTDFFQEVAKEEDNGDVIGATYKSIAFNGTAQKVSDDVLKGLYDKHKDEIVQLTGMASSGTNMYGSGFFIREGVVVTAWSLFQQFLSDSDYIYVSDVNGNTYKVDGVVAAQVDYDVVILKLKNETGKRAEFASSSDLKLDDNLFMINSKNNNGFSINYGSFISLDNGRLKNMFALSQSEVGSSLFNKEGKVVGFAVADQLYSELSYANSTDYLKSLQSILVQKDFKGIKCRDIETFKSNYYVPLTTEKKYDNVSNEDFERLSKVGKLKENVKFDLIKASYEDRILSLRYRTLDSSTIDSFYLISGFIDELDQEGFSLVQSTDSKKVYENSKYKVVIKESFNYLIIILVEK